MMERRKYSLTITLKSPFMFEGIVNDRVGIDSAYIRGEHGGPIIPSSQIKGVLRDALEHLAATTDMITGDDILALFGQASKRGGTEADRPERGRAFLSDLSAPKPTGDAVTTTRIEIDDDLGIVKRGHLQVVELAAPFGAEVSFSGTLVVRYVDDMSPERIERAINAAICLIPAIGGYKSAGFGETVPEKCGCALVSASTFAMPSGTDQERVTFDVTFDRPILVDTKREADNVFESSLIVPGSAFKGAIAELLALGGFNPENDTEAIGLALSRLFVSHAFPVSTRDPNQAVGAPIPTSIVGLKSDGKYVFADALDVDKMGCGVLFREHAGVPDFVAGGKGDIRSAYRSATGEPDPDHEEPPLLARTHIAMNEYGSVNDGDSRRLSLRERTFTAADHLLYSTTNVSTAGRKWRLTVDTSQIADRALARQILGLFSAEVDGIGRTSATATLIPTAATAAERVTAEYVDILLLTPAVLFDPVEVDRTTQRTREELYRNYFATHLGAELINFFAQQSLAGQYPAVRRRPYGKAYYPFVQTNPGAVFRLKVDSPTARMNIDLALQYGLPCPPIGGQPASWKTCPFIPENGYGAIRIHDPRKAFERGNPESAVWLSKDSLECVEEG